MIIWYGGSEIGENTHGLKMSDKQVVANGENIR